MPAGGICGDANAWFTLYSGATYEAPINGMYSFVPCRRVERDKFRFARPALSKKAAIRTWSRTIAHKPPISSRARNCSDSGNSR
jgi:hypothetical protein